MYFDQETWVYINDVRIVETLFFPVSFDNIPSATLNSHNSKFEFGADFSLDFGDKTQIIHNDGAKSANNMILNLKDDDLSLELNCDNDDFCGIGKAPENTNMYLSDISAQDEQIAKGQSNLIILEKHKCETNESIKDCANFGFSLPTDLEFKEYKIVVELDFDEAEWWYINDAQISDSNTLFDTSLDFSTDKENYNTDEIIQIIATNKQNHGIWLNHCFQLSYLYYLVNIDTNENVLEEYNQKRIDKHKEAICTAGMHNLDSGESMKIDIIDIEDNDIISGTYKIGERDYTRETSTNFFDTIVIGTDKIILTAEVKGNKKFLDETWELTGTLLNDDKSEIVERVSTKFDVTTTNDITLLIPISPDLDLSTHILKTDASRYNEDFGISKDITNVKQDNKITIDLSELNSTDNDTTSPPEDDTPKVPPEDDTPKVPPEDDTPKVPPEDDTPKVPPEDDTPKVPPEDDTPKVPPEDDTPKVPPEDDTPKVPPEDDTPKVPPEDDTPKVPPED